MKGRLTRVAWRNIGFTPHRRMKKERLMPATAAEVLQEFELESMTTRRVLERVPTDQLTWKPHPKSRSLGQLALHVAIGPGLISQWALQDSMEMPDMGEPPQPTSNAQILAVHD